MVPLLTLRPEGLYCPVGDFFVDPWRPVERAIITHAHSDHARSGHKTYLTHAHSVGILRARLGDEVSVTGIEYGNVVEQNGVRVSLHPAGHVLGSAQVRVEHKGEVWVVSGDYKLKADPTCAPFEPVQCHTFITEATFGLPIYRWPANETITAEINDWWRSNADCGRPSVLYAYAFGKAQRILKTVDDAIGPLFVHGTVDVLNAHYHAAGVRLPRALRPSDPGVTAEMLSRALVIAPPSASGTSWIRRFKNHSDGFASGWMQVRGARRRRNVDRGFVMSDHADWPGLQSAIEASCASRVLVTHGASEVVSRWLREGGLGRTCEAQVLATEFGDDELEEPTSNEIPDASDGEKSP